MRTIDSPIDVSARIPVIRWRPALCPGAMTTAVP